MSQFFKKFLTEDPSRLSPDTGRFLALGAFGKHPGWDDHIEDLGLETETLTLAKRVLYVQGVGGQIDTGAWEKLEPAQRTEGFNHTFVWMRSGQFLLGRMWSSSDGKGRTRYPMVVCAHCCNVSLPWALQNVLPRIAAVETACKATNAAADVRSILDRARAELRAALSTPAAGDTSASIGADALTRFVSHPAFGPDQEGWFRTLYQLQNQMAAYGLGSFNGKGDLSSLRPQQIRVPLAAPSADQAILFWSRFLASRIDQFVPAFFALPPGDAWLDVILGEPGTQEFFCLRALPAVLPLAADVPYSISEDFKAQAKAMLADFQAGKQPSGPVRSTNQESSRSGWTTFTQRWFKGTKLLLLISGGGIVLAASVAVFLSLYSGKNAGREQLPPGAPPTTAATGKTGPPSTQGQPAKAAPTEPAKTATPTSSQTPPETKSAVMASPTLAQGTNQPLLATNPPQPAPAPQLAVLPAPEEKALPPPLPPTTGVTNLQTPAAPSSAGDGTAAQTAPAEPSNAGGAVARPSPETAPLATPHSSPITNSIGMILIWVAALPGTAEGAWVAKFEVTQKEFETVIGSNPSKSKNPVQPVENVTWQEATNFCRKLTAREKGQGTLAVGFSYSLPAQVQWDFFLGDARFEDGVTSRTLKDPLTSPAKVGGLQANRFGLHDVLGNVWEWCADSGTSGEHVLKGSAYNSKTNILFGGPLGRTTPKRVSSETRSPDAGFRCILAPQP